MAHRFCTFTIAALLLAAQIGVARAACTNPAAAEAKLIYNQDYHVLQFCNGTDWVAVGTPGSCGGSGSSCSSVSGTGLVGYWKFDESSGSSTAADSSGNGNNGTLTNMNTSAAWVPGKLGNALNFDGSDDYVTIGTPATLSLSTTGTLSAWIKTNTTAFYPVIVGNANFQSDVRGYLLALDNSAHARLELCSTSGFTDLNTSSAYNDDNWHLITGTWDGTTMRLYLDGLGEIASMPQTTTPVSGTYPVTIGKDPGTSSSYFIGQIDEVRIYNRALSAAEALALYNNGTGCAN